MIAGIDYGSKLAGTTVICYDKDGRLHFTQSQKKKDADKMIIDWVSEHNPDLIMLDAPLSLPIVYRDPSKGSDYHYRQCDRELGAMSPMFLGGLTARAMKLRAQIAYGNCLETYPKQVMKSRFPLLKEFYKTDTEKFCDKLQENIPFLFESTLSNWHQVDSCLAWFAGWQMQHGEATYFGDLDEGRIHV